MDPDLWVSNLSREDFARDSLLEWLRTLFAFSNLKNGEVSLLCFYKAVTVWHELDVFDFMHWVENPSLSFLVWIKLENIKQDRIADKIKEVANTR